MDKCRNYFESKTPAAKMSAKVKRADESRKRKLQGTAQSFLNPFTAIFVIFLVIASISLASAVNMLPKITFEAPIFLLALVIFLFSFFVLCMMLRKYVSAYEEAVAKR